MKTQCPFCSNTVHLIHVHGHYQCPFCKTNAMPCCDGDNCNNLFINEGINETNEQQDAAKAGFIDQNTFSKDS